MRLKDFIGCFIFCACLVLPCFAVNAAGVTNYSSFISADYWVKNNPAGEQVILDAAGVAAYNKRIADKSPSVYDLKAYPQTLAGSTVKGYVSGYDVLNDPLFRLGKEVSQNYKNILIKETNTDKIPAQVNVRYGVTVRRSNLRVLPTNEGFFIILPIIILMLCRKLLLLFPSRLLFCIRVPTAFFTMCRAITTAAGFRVLT